MTVITVTAEHIAKGVRRICSSCPVALAIADAFPGADVWVGGISFDLYFDGGLTTIGGVDLPADVEVFIHAFDDGYEVAPFSFTVDCPEAAA